MQSPRLNSSHERVFKCHNIDSPGVSPPSAGIAPWSKLVTGLPHDGKFCPNLMPQPMSNGQCMTGSFSSSLDSDSYHTIAELYRKLFAELKQIDIQMRNETEKSERCRYLWKDAED
jgi:hypothetical protein